MEIEQLIKAKLELEADLRCLIHDRLQRFKNENGYSVARVDVAMNGYNFIGAQPVSVVDAVFVEVPIPGIGRQ